MVKGKRFGVGLSGGGYRAAAFHLGTLKKLNELGIINCVDVLSTISGGSITGAAFCLHTGKFEGFEQMMIHSLTNHNIIRYILTSWAFYKAIFLSLIFIVPSICLLFTTWAPFAIAPIVIFFWIILRFQFKIFPVSSIIEKAYDLFFFNKAKLQDLCSMPELAIGSTNLQTSRPFTFSKRKMGDSFYAFLPDPVSFKCDDFPVARAVIASSCVPFAFTPICIGEEFYSDYKLAQKQKVCPNLVDGGVYDNQGIQKLTQDGSTYACDIVLVSDAGNKIPFEKLYNNTFTLLLRTVDTFMVRIKNFQMAQNIFQTPNYREVAYQSLGWDIDNCLPGFYKSLLDGKISSDALKIHELRNEWILSPSTFKDEIISHMQERCHVNRIQDSYLKEADLFSIRNVGTNLTCLSKKTVLNLMSHAANLTEIQLRLYCPSLFIEQNEL